MHQPAPTHPTRIPILTALLALVLLAGCATLDDDETTHEATLTIDHYGAPGEGFTEHTITYDPHARPTMELYEATDTPRPDAYTVHDLIADWSTQTDTPITIQHSETLGFHVETIDETPSDPDDAYWALTVDGEPETASIGTIPVQPDTEYRLTFVSIEDPNAEAHQATVIIDYNGFRSEDPQRTTHTVPYDPTTQPTRDRYDDTNRPDAYTTHDLLHDWSNLTGTNHTAQPHDGFGHQLESIDGIVAHTTQGGAWAWDLYIDGEPETASISTITVQQDATYEWRFTHSSNA